MYIIHKYSMVLFPAGLILRNVRVHVYFSNYGNITFYIKIPVNKTLASVLFYKFQMLIYLIAILDLGDTLITWE